MNISPSEFNDSFLGPNLTNSSGKDNEIYSFSSNEIVVLSTLYGLTSLAAVLGNGLVFWVVLTSRRLQNITNYFIANLALSDITLGIFGIPFQFQAALLQRWTLPYFMCALCPFFTCVSINVSIFTLTCISVERYRAILYPLTHRSNRRRAKVIIGLVWLMAFTIAAPYAFALRIDMRPDSKGHEKPFCDYVGIPAIAMDTYSQVLVVIQYFAPLAVICYCYFHILVELSGRQTIGNEENRRDKAMLKNKKKIIKMLLWVVALFAISWLPLQIYNVLNRLLPSVNTYYYINVIWFCIHLLAMSNSFQNPFIYAIYNEKFQQEFRYRCRCCRIGRALSEQELREFQRGRTGGSTRLVSSARMNRTRMSNRNGDHDQSERRRYLKPEERALPAIQSRQKCSCQGTTSSNCLCTCQTDNQAENKL